MADPKKNTMDKKSNEMLFLSLQYLQTRMEGIKLYTMP